MGVCLDTTAAGTPPPPAMEDDTGKKVACSQKQVPLRAALKGGGPEGGRGGRRSLITLKDVDCVRDINNRDSRHRQTS